MFSCKHYKSQICSIFAENSYRCKNLHKLSPFADLLLLRQYFVRFNPFIFIHCCKAYLFDIKYLSLIKWRQQLESSKIFSRERKKKKKKRVSLQYWPTYWNKPSYNMSSENIIANELKIILDRYNEENKSINCKLMANVC